MYISVLMCTALCAVSATAQTYKCLVPDVKESDTAGFRNVAQKDGGTIEQKITVKQTLRKLGARCSKGKLVDRRGKQVRFYFLQGCWGNPPDDYLEILEKQRKEIAELKRRFVLVELPCGSGGPLRN